MSVLIPGDIVRCKRTVSLSKKEVIVVKGYVYQVRSIIRSCCGIWVDIGHDHHSPIINTCALCGAKRKEKTIYIPSSYFSLHRKEKDKLKEALNKIERSFILFNLR